MTNYSQQMVSEYREAIPMTIGGKEFPSKSAAMRAVKKLLWETPLNESLHKEDFFLIHCLLGEHHPRGLSKIGAGIAEIIVSTSITNARERNSFLETGSRMFVLKRIDDTWDNFSYKDCFIPESEKV